VRQWIETVVPLAVHKMTRDCQTAKSCGVLSDFVCGLSERAGIGCLVVNVPGHFLNVFPLDDGGGILLDTTALQFQLPYGSYRDTDEPEEQALIRKRFRAAELDPFSVVKVERISPAKFARLRTHEFKIGPMFTKRSIKKLEADMMTEVPDMGSKADFSPLDKAFATANPGARQRGMISNPPWVDEIVTANLRELTFRAPKGAEVVVENHDGHIHAPELGCGAYGCVLSTSDPNVVCKITSDVTEATFVRLMKERELAKTPGITRYLGVSELEGRRSGRAVYALWREAASDVGKLVDWDGTVDRLETPIDAARFANRLLQFRWFASMARYVLENAKDGYKTRGRAGEMAAWAAPRVTLDAAVKAYRQASKEESTFLDETQGPQRLALAIRACEIIADAMMLESPAGALVGESFLELRSAGILLADVHGGNVGRVQRPEHYDGWKVWVVTDPGHMILI
jgi:hypothetical protein